MFGWLTPTPASEALTISEGKRRVSTESLLSLDDSFASVLSSVADEVSPTGGSLAEVQEPSIFDWLESVKPGYAARFALAFESAGVEDEEDLRHIDVAIFRDIEAALTAACDAKPMHVKNIRLALEKECGCVLELPPSPAALLECPKERSSASKPGAIPGSSSHAASSRAAGGWDRVRQHVRPRAAASRAAAPPTASSASAASASSTSSSTRRTTPTRRRPSTASQRAPLRRASSANALATALGRSPPPASTRAQPATARPSASSAASPRTSPRERSAQRSARLATGRISSLGSDRTRLGLTLGTARRPAPLTLPAAPSSPC